MKITTRVREKLGGGYAGIHSVEVAAEILLQLANFRHPTSLKTLSDLCSLTPSKVHRYLSSMAKLGLVFHGQKSGNYSLGRNAIVLGLAAMQQNDQINEVFEELPNLVREIKCHVALLVWSKSGPTIVKWERDDNSPAVGLPLGHVMPIAHSASGLVFSAFLKPALTHELIAQETISYGEKARWSEEELQTILKTVRDKRFAVFRGDAESETTAMAVPIVDWENNPIVVVAAVVSKNTTEDRILSILTALANFSERLSVHKPSFPFEPQ